MGISIEFIIILFLLGIIIILLVASINEKKASKISKEKLTEITEEFTKLDYKKCSLCREIDLLLEQIEMLQQREIENLPTIIKVLGEKITVNQMYMGKKIIIGNYDKILGEEERRLLMSFGIKVFVIRSAEDIVNMIENGFKCDMIITNNVYKGKMSGRDLLDKLKENKEFTTPIVIHTISTGERGYFMSLGFDEYLEKPLKVKDVENVLKKFLTKSRK